MDIKDLERIYDEVAIGVWVIDRELNWVYVNDYYAGLFGVTKEYFKGRNLSDDRREGHVKYVICEEVLEKKQQLTRMIVTSDTPFQAQHQVVTATPVFEDGEIVYIVGVAIPYEAATDRIQTAILNQRMRGNTEHKSDIRIIAEDTRTKSIFRILARVALQDVSILIEGPSGSGKEVAAQYVHSMSSRANYPMIAINCGSIPENLIEAELFGYVKGAFTGAAGNGKKGLIEAANNGTLFLDEIGAMPQHLQKRLLRVLETKEVRRIGAVESTKVDFRLIAATNEDLEAKVKAGLFREDLFYRLNVVPVKLPPLRERQGDIIPLAEFFLEEFSKKYGYIKALSEPVKNFIMDYSWPGNVRELRNFIERLYVLSDAEEKEVTMIPDGAVFKSFWGEDKIESAVRKIKPEIILDDNFSYRDYMEECDRRVIQMALRQYKTTYKAADALKTSQATVAKKKRKFNL